jgi:hypothetical protein
MAPILQKPDWRRFEEAVASFLQALDPSAKVTHDVTTADRETGLPRQRDVWIETTFGGHLPLTILVSCKRTKAKISQQEMDAFRGELMASSASLGVLYSAVGFTVPAITKATKLGIACCMLLEDCPADLPGMLRFDGYCFRERVRLTLRGDPNAFATMSELFDLAVDDDGARSTVIARLLRHYEAAKPDINGRASWGLPPTWSAAIEVSADGSLVPLQIQLDAAWRTFRSRREAWLVNGSYCFNNEDFKGSYSTPAVDRLSDHPGPGWEEIDFGDVVLTGNRAWLIFHGGDWEPTLRNSVGSHPPQSLAQPYEHHSPAGAGRSEEL